MRGYTKDEVETHGGRPAVNVKARHWPDATRVVERFGCSEETALRASQYAYESHVEVFWEDAQAVAEVYFGPECEVWAEGRSGGWLVAPWLGIVEDWDGVTLNRWALFERRIRELVRYLCSWEAVEDTIESNEWAVDNAAIEGMMQAAAEALA